MSQQSGPSLNQPSAQSFAAKSLPLFELYTRLQEAGLPLGLKEYAQLLKALQAGFGVSDRAGIARVCTALWVKNEEEAYLFNYHFAEVMGDRQQSFAEMVKENEQRSRLAKETAYAEQLTVRITRQAMNAIVLASSLFLAAFLVFYLRQPPLQPEPSPIETLPPQPLPEEAPEPAPPTAPAEEIQRVSVVFLGTLVAALLLGTGVAWLFIRRFTLLQAAPPTAAEEDLALTEKITVSQTSMTDADGDEVQLAETLRQTGQADTKVPRLKVLGQDEYFPITRRQMKQGWRYLRRRSREGPKTEFDVAGTVRHIAQQGSFFRPVMRASRKNRTDLIFLIDQDGSMVPFQSLSKRLVNTATRAGRLGKASTYYFHNCPSRYLYCDPLMQQPEPLEHFLSGRLSGKSIVIIVSDAGAARGGLNTVRVKKTKAFVDQLSQYARYTVWLNPLPKSRWESTTAGNISNFIAMFEVNRTGFQKAIDVLRGRWKPGIIASGTAALHTTDRKVTELKAVP